MSRQPISIEGMWRPNHASLPEAHERHERIFDAAKRFTHTASPGGRLVANLLWGPVGTQRAMDLARYNEKGKGMSWARGFAGHKRDRFTQE